MNRQLLLDVLPAPAPSLNNYIAGPNGEALAAVRALNPGPVSYTHLTLPTIYSV